MTLSVLAVDDSRTMRGALKRALGDAGFAVRLAEDGVDALAALEDARPDVILTDINMPRMNGFGLIARVRDLEGAERIPILVLTTESGEALKARARAAGATGWIVKPFDGTKLVAAIRRVAA
ncbi:MAG: response regulator [Pseudomonadota bacterium]